MFLNFVNSFHRPKKKITNRTNDLRRSFSICNNCEAEYTCINWSMFMSLLMFSIFDLKKCSQNIVLSFGFYIKGKKKLKILNVYFFVTKNFLFSCSFLSISQTTFNLCVCVSVFMYKEGIQSKNRWTKMFITLSD